MSFIVKPKLRLFLISAVWVVWLILVLLLVKSGKVDRSEVFEKSGLVINAQCIESRSVRGVKFKVHYEDEKESRYDFIDLPLEVVCDKELIKRFENSEIEILAYRNYYLEVNIDGLVLWDLEEKINDFNDKSGSIYFLLFLAVAASFGIFFSGRGKRKKS